MSKGPWKIKFNKNGTINLRSVQNMKLSTFIGKCIDLGIVPAVKHRRMITIKCKDGKLHITKLDGFSKSSVKQTPIVS